jgi:hypothetical protein
MICIKYFDNIRNIKMRDFLRTENKSYVTEALEEKGLCWNENIQQMICGRLLKITSVTPAENSVKYLIIYKI